MNHYLVKIFVSFKQPDDKNDEQAVNNHKRKIKKQVKLVDNGGWCVAG